MRLWQEACVSRISMFGQDATFNNPPDLVRSNAPSGASSSGGGGNATPLKAIPVKVPPAPEPKTAQQEPTKQEQTKEEAVKEEPEEDEPPMGPLQTADIPMIKFYSPGQPYEGQGCLQCLVR